MTMLELSDAATKAKCESTIVLPRGQDERWLQNWSAKAEEADIIMVVFDECYKVDLF